MRESLWQEPRWNAGRRARPEGARAAARKAAEVTEQRLTAFRFLYFILPSPDETKWNPGVALKLFDRPRIALRRIRATASDSDRDEAGRHHNRIHLTKIGF